MPKIFKRVQFGFQIEANTGVLPSGFDTNTDNYDIGILEPTFTPDIESFERDFARAQISRTAGIQGQKAIGLSFGTELLGTSLGTFAGGAPGWGRLLTAANFRQVGTDTLALAGAITGGPFRHGEIVTGATAGTGTVVHDTHDGATVLYIHSSSGTWNAAGELITGQSTGATATTTATPHTTDQGFSWFPISEERKTIATTGTLAGTIPGKVLEAANGARVLGISYAANVLKFKAIRGALITGQTLFNLTDNISTDLTTSSAASFDWGGSAAMILNMDGTAVFSLGSRATVTAVMEVNRPVRLNFETRGFFGTPADKALVSGDKISSKNPPLWQNNSTFFASNDGSEPAQADELVPCLTGLQLNIGNQFGDRRCASASAGLEEVVIQNRQGAATINTEQTYESDIAWLGKIRSGVVQRMRTTIGTALGNQFKISAPGLQYEGTGRENQNGIPVYSVGAKLTGGSLYDLDGPANTLSGVGGDNELVITYLVAAP